MNQEALDYFATPGRFTALDDAEFSSDDIDEVVQVVRSVDGRPLQEARPAGSRVGARCHAFSRLTVAFLRAARVPARARCGFGTYFRPGWRS